MAIDATFWVAVSFVIFFGALIYLKIPQKIKDNMIEFNKNEYEKIFEKLAEIHRLKQVQKQKIANIDETLAFQFTYLNIKFFEGESASHPPWLT